MTRIVVVIVALDSKVPLPPGMVKPFPILVLPSAATYSRRASPVSWHGVSARLVKMIGVKRDPAPASPCPVVTPMRHARPGPAATTVVEVDGVVTVEVAPGVGVPVAVVVGVAPGSGAPELAVLVLFGFAVVLDATGFDAPAGWQPTSSSALQSAASAAAAV